MHLLECRGLRKKKGEFALEEITCSVDAGYVLGVIGRNGAGKTTFSRLLLGSYRPDAGDIFLQGISAGTDRIGYQGKLAFVLSQSPFPAAMTPRECEKLYGCYYHDFDREKYYRLLQQFEVPEKRQIKNLSQGQQIRQQLAFALSYEAAVYVFDEPGARMDVKFREEFHRIIRKLTEDETKTVIYVSHLVDELEQIADYVLWLSEGRQKYFGTLDHLREEYQLLEVEQDVLAAFPDIPVAGMRERSMHQEVLVRAGREEIPEQLKEYSRYASLKEIMYYTEKGDERDETDR